MKNPELVPAQKDFERGENVRANSVANHLNRLQLIANWLNAAD
jgi:hypothetical protein